EGLQHQDGHSLVLASTVPVCQAYDPAFAYELGTIVEDGIRRMYGENPEDIFYYLTLYNENYSQPERPEGVEEGILEGLYRWSDRKGDGIPATILFSGTANLAAREAVEELSEHYGVDAELWSATSYKKLREEAVRIDRWNRLHPGEPPRKARVTEILEQSEGPIVAVSDFMTMVPDQVSRWVPRRFSILGTDGFGRSDSRSALRDFFEIDAGHVVVATLASLAAEGTIEADRVSDGMERYGIEPDTVDPSTVH
ncbi:MAG: pyruvate dehydrogenase (acetyl-transferring), homodimeric type, partial [Actinobacteria bacterium]